MDNLEPIQESSTLEEDKTKVEDTEIEAKAEETEEISEESDDDEIQLAVPPKKQEILKEFPEVFKKFPYLEKSLFRDKQFTEVYATPREAKEASEKLEFFNGLETDLASGSSEGFLKHIKSQDEDAFKTLVDNYLPSLKAVDETAYFNVIGNVGRSIASHLYAEGDRLKNESLKVAASIITQFLGINDGKQYVNYGAPKNEESKKLIEEREKFAKERLEEKQKDTTEVFINSLKSTIEENIDPKGTMSDYVRRNAIREVQESVEIALEEDEQFNRFLDRLWIKAASENYSKAALKKIKDVCLSKSKTLLPSVIARVRNEAIKGNAKRAEKEEKRGLLSARQPAPESGSGSKAGQKLPAGTRSIDFLMQD